MKYNKLVRDKIPVIIEANGDQALTHIADDEEYRQKLREKLLEEVNEYLESEESEEIADIYEVLDAIIKNKNFDKQAILNSQEQKREKRGGFGGRIILDETI